MKAITPKCIDELELFRIRMKKACIETDDRTENSYGNTGDDNGTRTGSKPDDLQGSKS